MSKKLTTNEWIEKARQVHGDKYDYSKVEYVNAATKVYIVCPEHGGFWQSANSHLMGRGCPKCANIKRSEALSISTKEFIERATKKYGDKYSYDKVVYKDAFSPVIVHCDIHGDFEIQPTRHLTGYGCPDCGREKRYLNTKRHKTTTDFIDELIEKYGDRLDYSEIDYINAKTPVWITDKILGLRYQITPTHLLTRGLLQKEKNTLNNFIEKARQVHGDRYDYSKVDYKGSQTKVCIICPEHGEFWQTPYNHVMGYGCPKCGKKHMREKLAITKDDFIKKANTIHGGFFTYNNFTYIDYHTKSNITCPYHGDFQQSPAKHLDGHGCPKCNESSLEREVRLYLEENNIEYIKEFSDDWLKNGRGKQRFDYFIKNTNYLIECQGIQHFIEPNFKYKTNITKTLERDERKYNLALEHGYKVLYYTTEENKKYSDISQIYKNNIYTNITELNKVINNGQKSKKNHRI